MIIDPKPLRLRILIALTDLLKTVTPANGYQFDLSDVEAFEDDPYAGHRVIRGRLFIGDSEPPTMVSILEPPSAVEPILNRGPDNTARASEWDILIQGWARDDDDNEPCDLAYALAAEVHRVLGSEIKRTRTGRPGAPNILGLGGKLEFIKIGTPVIRPSEEVSGYGVFYTILTLKIVEDIADPFG